MPDDPLDRDDRLAAAVAELYEASPEDFTARRGELAAAAREAGDRPAAKAIGALRRPTRAAWVVNRLARDDPGAPRRLAELAAALNAAQQAGHGPRLRELSAARWALIDTLTAQALAAARLADPPPSLRLEVAQTITAALGDPGVAADFAAGTLTRAAQWSGFGLAPEGASGGADAGTAAMFGAESADAEAGGAEAAVPPQRRAPAAMTDGPRTGRAPADRTEPAAGRGVAPGTTARERTGPAWRPEPGAERAAPRPEPGAKRGASRSATARSEAARSEAARSEAAAERAAAEPREAARREAARREAARREAAGRAAVAEREAAHREAREAAERADRRRQQYEEAERTVATAAAAAADAVAAEDRLETEVRDLEQRLTRARAELATARMRARHAETAERRARQAFDRMPGQ